VLRGIVVLATCWSVEDVNHVSVITTPTLVIRTLDNAMSVFSVLYYSTIKVIWRKESLPLLQFAIACFFWGGVGLTKLPIPWGVWEYPLLTHCIIGLYKCT